MMAPCSTHSSPLSPGQSAPTPGLLLTCYDSDQRHTAAPLTARDTTLHSPIILRGGTGAHILHSLNMMQTCCADHLVLELFKVKDVEYEYGLHPVM